MKYILPALRYKLFMTLLLGLLYPLLMTAIAKVIFPRQASGEFISRGGQVVGAKLIAQKFERPEYFWARPSAVDYNPLPSGGSNLGQASQDLKKAFDERVAKLKAAHADQTVEPPQDLLFASGSGLDPHISPEAAQYQIGRVANARNTGRNLSIDQLQKLVEASTEPRQLGFFGESVVNVLALNLALDKMQGIETAPVFIPPPPASAGSNSSGSPLTNNPESK